MDAVIDRLKRMLLQIASFLTAVLIPFIAANVEKIIFLAPEHTLSSTQYEGLNSLNLNVISPSQPTLRATIQSSFPRSDRPNGTESWYVLEQLRPGQRYELRICWPATVGLGFSVTFPQQISPLRKEWALMSTATNFIRPQTSQAIRCVESSSILEVH